MIYCLVKLRSNRWRGHNQLSGRFACSCRKLPRSKLHISSGSRPNHRSRQCSCLNILTQIHARWALICSHTSALVDACGRDGDTFLIVVSTNPETTYSGWKTPEVLSCCRCEASSMFISDMIKESSSSPSNIWTATCFRFFIKCRVVPNLRVKLFLDKYASERLLYKERRKKEKCKGFYQRGLWNRDVKCEVELWVIRV